MVHETVTLPAGANVLAVATGASYKHQAARRPMVTAREANGEVVATWYIDNAAHLVVMLPTGAVVLVAAAALATPAAVLAAAPVAVVPANPLPPAPAYTVPAGVTVFAVRAEDAARKVRWGRQLVKSQTTRVNAFALDDLADELPTALVFRLRSNRQGYALLMVPKDQVQRAAV